MSKLVALKPDSLSPASHTNLLCDLEQVIPLQCLSLLVYKMEVAVAPPLPWVVVRLAWVNMCRVWPSACTECTWHMSAAVFIINTP